MASNFNIIPLHRGAKMPCSGTATGPDPFPVADALTDLERRLRDDRPDMIEQLRSRRPSTMQRIVDHIDSPFAVGLYIGCYAGCLLTVLLAYLWSVAL